jgi:hypothetical protein
VIFPESSRINILILASIRLYEGLLERSSTRHWVLGYWVIIVILLLLLPLVLDPKLDLTCASL